MNHQYLCKCLEHRQTEKVIAFQPGLPGIFGNSRGNSREFRENKNFCIFRHFSDRKGFKLSFSSALGVLANHNLSIASHMDEYRSMIGYITIGDILRCRGVPNTRLLESEIKLESFQKKKK